jgi:hypothetical protein
MLNMPPAKVHLEPDWIMQGVKVYLLASHESRGGVTAAWVGLGDDRAPILQNFAQGEEIPPAMILPRDWLEAIVREASGIMPATDATVDALNDARVVRDRLLTIVERP